MIILLGFPKSGTSSFQKLFTDLGYNSYHHMKNRKYIGTLIKNNKYKNKPLLSDFNKNDCITQMDVCVDKRHNYWPQLIDYKQIYFENSDSIFILNKRNPITLLSSFSRWNSYDQRLYKYNSELFNDDIFKGIKMDEALIKLFNIHYNNIETFFALHPSAKFMSYDIEKDDISKLNKYIDLKGIKVFPKENVNKKK